jgi:hypothetical protein
VANILALKESKMVRTAILATLLLAGVTTVASAESVFTGTIKFTAVTTQCRNVRVNDFGNSVFHPKITGNANFAGLSWVWSHYAHGHVLSNLNFDATLRTVVTGGVGWGDVYTKPATQASKIAITAYSPPIANITASTQTVIIVGKIARPFNDPGGLSCVATFLGTYVKDARQ